MTEINDLIAAANAGDLRARDALFAAAYDELQKLARARLHDGGRNTYLDTTALVHETYLRCQRAGELRAEHRRAFFAYAGQVMRSVIVDAARERRAERRGGDQVRMTLDTRAAEELPAEEDRILEIDEALQRLALVEPRLAQVVEMRYFGGYEETEIADVLGLTPRTVRRDWDKARRLLMVMLPR